MAPCGQYSYSIRYLKYVPQNDICNDSGPESRAARFGPLVGVSVLLPGWCLGGVVVVTHTVDDRNPASPNLYYTTTIPRAFGTFVYNRYVRALAKIIFYLLKDGCIL